MTLVPLVQSITLSAAIPLIVGFSIFTLCIYRLYFHPLSHIPGPLICRLTSFWTYWHSYIGDEATLIIRFHERYGPVVRVAPNEVTISDGSCLTPIYSDHGGFMKSSHYRNFDIDGFATLFSETDKDSRAPRARSVLPLFSTASLRAGESVLEECVQGFIRRLQAEKEHSVQSRGHKAINILNLARSLGLDTVTTYLFDQRYGGLDETNLTRLSAGDFVDSLVAIGRFFYLPNRVFFWLDRFCERLVHSRETHESAAKVDGYLRGIVRQSTADDGTYPGRMLKAGLAPDEVVSQCKDIIFGGLDSTGTTLSTFCWQLVQNHQTYSKVKQEVSIAREANPNGYDASSLPYLRACLRETLRLAMAQPTRRPRVVPPDGWAFTCHANGETYYFPPGSLVSAQSHTLHMNPEVFVHPTYFDPDRWSEERVTKEMLRDLVPFGVGARRCIAQNFAMTELTLAARAIIESGILEGARTVLDKIEVIEWFNGRITGGSVELTWLEDKGVVA